MGLIKRKYRALYLLQKDDAEATGFDVLRLDIVARNKKAARKIAQEFSRRHLLPMPWRITYQGIYRKLEGGIFLSWGDVREQPREEPAGDRDRERSSEPECEVG